MASEPPYTLTSEQLTLLAYAATQGGDLDPAQTEEEAASIFNGVIAQNLALYIELQDICNYLSLQSDPKVRTV